MVLLILVLLWAVVLTPYFVRKWMDRRPAGSIELFHHQLHLLERTGPKLVPPAYRLETAFPGGGTAPPGELPPAAGRPNLVLLQPIGAEGTGGGDEVVDESSGEHYRRVPTPVPAPPVAELTAAPSIGELRRLGARRRRRDLVLGLVATMVVTGLAGFAHSLHVVWVLTGLAGLALAGFVGLAVYAQILENEGGSQPRPEPRHAAPRTRRPRHAAAGYPGAWDEEDLFDEPYGYQRAGSGR